MKMRVIPTKVHAAVDYATAPALVFAPELFRMKDGKSASLPPRVAGVSGAAYSVLTDHELAARRVLPMKAHLALDAASGIAIAAMPWLGGSARSGVRYWLPHALVGAKEVALALTTETRPGDRRRRLPDLPLGRKPLLGAAVASALLAAGLYVLSRGRGQGEGDESALP